MNISSLISSLSINRPKIGMKIKFISSIVRTTLYGVPKIIPGAIDISLVGKASNLTVNTPAITIKNWIIPISSRVSSLAFGNFQIKGQNAIIFNSSITSSLSINEFLAYVNKNIHLNSRTSSLIVNNFILYLARNIGLQSYTRLLKIGLCKVKIEPKNIVTTSISSKLTINQFTITSIRHIILSGKTSTLQIQKSTIKNINNIGITSIVRVTYYGDITARRTLRINSVTTNLSFGLISITPGAIGVLLGGKNSDLAINEFILRKKLVVTFSSLYSSFTMGNQGIVYKSTTKFLDKVDSDWVQVSGCEEFYIDGVFISNRWGITHNIKVLFDNNYESVNAFQPVLGLTNPRVTCMDKFQFKPVKNDKIIVNGVNYTITAYEPDGTGIATLQLQNERTN